MVCMVLPRWLGSGGGIDWGGWKQVRRYETGLPPPIASRSTALKIWRDPVTDKWSAEQQPELAPPTGAAVVDAYFRFDDPMPWLVLLGSRIKGRVRALIGR